LKGKERIEIEVQLVILEEELRIIKQKQERLLEKIRSRSNSRSSKTPTLFTHYEKDNRLVDNFYQPPHPSPRRNIRSRVPRESKEHRVDLSHFYGKKDVETYLDWVMKEEQLFACHQVSEET